MICIGYTFNSGVTIKLTNNSIFLTKIDRVKVI